MIDDDKEINRIRDHWDSLVNRSSRNPFLLADFVRSFSSLNKASGWNPLIVTVSDEKDLLAAVPLTVKRFYGLKLARFVVRPSYSPDFVSNKDESRYVSQAVDYIFNHGGCHILSLVFEGKPRNSRSLINELEKLGIHFSFGSQSGHRVLPITSTWEEFESRKGSNFRHKFRRIERNLNKLGAWNVTHVSRKEIGQDALEKILEVEGESWKEAWRANEGKERHDTLPAVLSGLGGVMRNRSDLEWNMYFLEVEGKPIAYSLVICYAGVAYITKTSYKAQYRRFYPGIYVNHAAIRNLWSTRAFTLIDFLTDLQFMGTWTDMIAERSVFVMSKNPFLPPAIGFLFLNDQIQKGAGSILGKAMKIFPTFPA